MPSDMLATLPFKPSASWYFPSPRASHVLSSDSPKPPMKEPPDSAYASSRPMPCDVMFVAVRMGRENISSIEPSKARPTQRVTPFVKSHTVSSKAFAMPPRKPVCSCSRAAICWNIGSSPTSPMALPAIIASGDRVGLRMDAIAISAARSRAARSSKRRASLVRD